MYGLFVGLQMGFFSFLELDGWKVGKRPPVVGDLAVDMCLSWVFGIKVSFIVI